MIYAVLIAAAFTLSLFVNSTTSLYNGAWIAFFFSACFILLFTGQHQLIKDKFTYSLIAWGLWVVASAFFLAISVAADSFSIRLIIPVVLVLALMREDAKEITLNIVKCVSVPLILLACFISFRYLIGGLGDLWWPFRNPNNLAAVLSFGLVGFFALGFKDKKYWLLVPVFALAVYSTQCRTIMIAAGISFVFLLIHYDEDGVWKTSIPLVLLTSIGVLWITYNNHPGYFISPISSMNERIEIWKIALRAIYENPFIGSGLGEFKSSYPQYVAQDLGINIDIPKTTHLFVCEYKIDYETARALILRDILQLTNAGYFVHNEPLQFTQEMGIPALILFYLIGITALKQLSIEGKAMLLAIGISSHLSFHLHLPSIMILLAITLTLRKEEST